MRVLVVGATGGTGRELVSQALEQGHQVAAFARNPAKVREKHDRLRVVRGDVLDLPSVEAAVQGQDAVLCALGHKLWFSPAPILSRGTENILRAMQKHGVRRLVCETALGVGDSAGRLGVYYTLFVIPFILPLYYLDKERQEHAIRASDLDWVIVRPGALTNGKKRGKYRHGRVGNFLWTVGVSRADVADFMLKQLAADTYRKLAVGICD